MRLFSSTAVALAFTAVATGGGGESVGAHGVALTTPGSWHRVASAGDGSVTDPRTLLVVGTARVVPKSAQCQIAAYHVPTRGAVVVVVGWKTATSGGGRIKPGRRPLKALTSVTQGTFECYAGRGAAASLTLGGKAYQVNVLVGNATSAKDVAAALAVGRSFRLAP